MTEDHRVRYDAIVAGHGRERTGARFTSSTSGTFNEWNILWFAHQVSSLAASGFAVALGPTCVNLLKS
jgi:hypothetical protein